MGALREETVEEDTPCMDGMTITKGTVIHIMKDYDAPQNPMDGKFYNFKVVRVDNGTGMLKLMPEACIRKEVKN